MFNPGFNKTPPVRFGAGSTREGAPAPISFSTGRGHGPQSVI
jgi:hypothetical protein